LLHAGEAHALDPLDQQLRHAVAGRDPEGLVAVVDQHDLELAPVVAVDHARERVDAVAHGEAAARPDEADVPGRDLEAHAGRDGRASAPSDLDRLARAEIRARGARGGVAGQRSASVQQHRHDERRVAFLRHRSVPPSARS
jgi:hypothetical protein